MAATIPLLRRDHVNFTRVLNALQHQVEVADTGGDPSVPLLKLILTYFKGYPRKVHHPKEDLIYGALVRNAPEIAPHAFQVLEYHRELGANLEALEHAVHLIAPSHPGSVKTFCAEARAFIERETAHMTLEEGFLYPDAVHRLSAEEWADIDRVMASDSDPLFGDAVAAPYEQLREAITFLDKRLQLRQQ